MTSVCFDCGDTNVSEKVEKYSREKFDNKVYCFKCQQKRRADQQQVPSEPQAQRTPRPERPETSDEQRTEHESDVIARLTKIQQLLEGRRR